MRENVQPKAPRTNEVRGVLGLALSEKPTALVFKKFAKLQMYFFSKNRYHLNKLYELSAKTLKDVFIGVDRRPTPPVFYTGEDTVIPILFKQIVSAHAAKARDKNRNARVFMEDWHDEKRGGGLWS